MNQEIIIRLREFMENEARSCSMDCGCVTPEYVYRMWGGSVALEEIANAMSALQHTQEPVRRVMKDYVSFFNVNLYG